MNLNHLREAINKLDLPVDDGCKPVDTFVGTENLETILCMVADLLQDLQLRIEDLEYGSK